MPTTVLDVVSKAFPSITNRIRASIFNEDDPLAIVASIIDSTSGHPQRVWHFPGLPRANYGFSLDEINGSDVPIRNLAFFDVVPSAIDGLLTRNDEQIKVGNTPGFDTGLSTVTFDGSETSPGSGLFKPDYTGWVIVPSELTGRGILAVDLDYTWDPITGTFSLIQGGDILASGTNYNIHFNPHESVAGGSVPTVNDFSTRLITSTGNIDITDFGNCIIIEPIGTYIELTLPDILTVPQGRMLRVETSPLIGIAGLSCVKFLTSGADIINFLRGNLYMMNNESFDIYRFRRPDTSNEWRVRNPAGNFKSVGRSVSEDSIQTGLFCEHLMDGSARDKFQYARIFNEHVLHLPGTQVVNYDDWTTGNNKYLFSLANSSNPANANKFHFPDRRGLYERNNNTGKSGDWANWKIIDHFHQTGHEATTTGGVYNRGDDHTVEVAAGSGAGNSDRTRKSSTANIYATGSISGDNLGTEISPVNYLINKYVLV